MTRRTTNLPCRTGGAGRLGVAQVSTRPTTGEHAFNRNAGSEHILRALRRRFGLLFMLSLAAQACGLGFLPPLTLSNTPDGGQDVPPPDTSVDPSAGPTNKEMIRKFLAEVPIDESTEPDDLPSSVDLVAMAEDGERVRLYHEDGTYQTHYSTIVSRLQPDGSRVVIETRLDGSVTQRTFSGNGSYTVRSVGNRYLDKNGDENSQFVTTDHGFLFAGAWTDPDTNAVMRKMSVRTDYRSDTTDIVVSTFPVDATGPSRKDTHYSGGNMILAGGSCVLPPRPVTVE
jgi:hypothetical protein